MQSDTAIICSVFYSYLYRKKRGAEVFGGNESCLGVTHTHRHTNLAVSGRNGAGKAPG